MQSKNFIHDDSTEPEMLSVHTFSVDDNKGNVVVMFEVYETWNPKTEEPHNFHFSQFLSQVEDVWELLELERNDFGSLVDMCIDLLEEDSTIHG